MASALRKEIINELLQEGLSKGHSLTFEVISPSMFPLLSVGDKIILKAVAPEELHCGDLIAYRNKEKLIIHRFLTKTPERNFIFKGDNSPAADKPIDPKMIFGKAISVEGRNKKIDLKNRKWEITNSLLGKANLLKTETPSLAKDIRAALLQLLARLLNNQYSQLTKTSYGHYEPEKEFLILATKNKLTENEIKLLQNIIEEGIDWHKILSLALYNNVGPILYKNIQNLPEDTIPERIREGLKENYTESFLKTAPIYDDLAKLLAEFEKANVKIIILKGCSFAELLYGDFSLRPLKDIDLLVRKSDWPKIKEILDKLKIYSENRLDLLKLETLLQIPTNWQLSYKNSRKTELEFKFNIFIMDFPDFADVDDYWKESVPSEVVGTKTLSFSIDDQVLYLSCRLISTAFRNLLWFCDLREFVTFYREKINWQKLIAKARRKRLNTILYFSLLILKKRMGVDLPAGTLDSLKPIAFKRWFLKYLYNYKNTIFITPQGTDYPTDDLIALCVIFGKVGIRDTARFLIYLKKLLFPSREFLTYRYGEAGKIPALKHNYQRISKILVGLQALTAVIIRKFFNKKLKSRTF
ncbi:MAG: nucleotidyltransferase family protein [Candidatus Omnitrophota bacterium]|nr:nucleotidyltransferase family protein [Candidatus Omnitrophota bacterium]